MILGDIRRSEYCSPKGRANLVNPGQPGQVSCRPGYSSRARPSTMQSRPARYLVARNSITRLHMRSLVEISICQRCIGPK